MSMSHRSICVRWLALFIAMATFMSTPSALALGRNAEPQCAQVICLSPRDGTPAPAECRSIRAVYFDIRIYTPPPKFNPGATQRARDQWLKQCRSARPIDLQKISIKYGRLFADPIVY